MSDIFREVDEALQREKAEKLWKTYGPTLVVAAILVVLTTGLTTGYKEWVSHRNKVETAKLLTAIESNDKADDLEKVAGDTDDGHKALALMNAAAQHAEKGEFAKASALYDDVSKDKSVPDDLRDLASIYYVRAAMLSSGTEEKPEYKALTERLVPITRNQNAAFHLQAKLDTALLYGDGLKDYNAALALLDGFEGNAISPSLKEKASALKHVYEYELSSTATPAASADQASDK